MRLTPLRRSRASLALPHPLAHAWLPEAARFYAVIPPSPTTNMSHTTTRGVAFCRPHQSARTRLRAIKANAAQRGVHPPASGWASIAACRGVCTFCTFCISTRCPTSPASTDLQQRLAPLQSARALLAGAAQPCGSGLAADDRQCRRLQSPNATRLAAWRHGGMAPQVRPRPMVSMGRDGTHSYIGSPGDCYSAIPV